MEPDAKQDEVEELTGDAIKEGEVAAEEGKKADIGKLADMLFEFGQDLNSLHKETEALKMKALLYNNKYIVRMLDFLLNSHIFSFIHFYPIHKI